MTKTKEVTCRYGIAYKTTFSGTREAVERSFSHLTACCCWCCFNHACTEPRNEKIPACGEVCEIYGMKSHPCEKSKTDMAENELKEKLADAICTIVKRVPDFSPDYNQIAKNGADVIMGIIKEYNK